MKQELTIHIDGASRGNPGPAGIGIVISASDNNSVRKMYKYIGETTNNVAEYTALIYALQEALIIGASDVVIKTDSELVTKQIKGEYKIKNVYLKAFYEQYLHLRNGFNKLDVRLIPRRENAAADKLANKAVEARISTSLKHEE